MLKAVTLPHTRPKLETLTKTQSLHCLKQDNVSSDERPDEFKKRDSKHNLHLESESLETLRYCTQIEKH